MRPHRRRSSGRRRVDTRTLSNTPRHSSLHSRRLMRHKGSILSSRCEASASAVLTTNFIRMNSRLSVPRRACSHLQASQAVGMALSGMQHHHYQQEANQWNQRPPADPYKPQGGSDAIDPRTGPSQTLESSVLVRVSLRPEPTLTGEWKMTETPWAPQAVLTPSAMVLP